MATDLLSIAGISTLPSPMDPSIANGVFRTTFNPNLFKVVITDEVGYEDPSTITPEVTELLCSGALVKNPTLKYSDQHIAYRDTYVTGIDIPDEITFNWYEGNRIPVWRFHQGWMTRYYDRVRDTFVSGKMGKLKHAVITLHDYENDQLIPRFQFVIWGLKPTSVPDLDLGWAKDPGDYTITYKYRMIQFQASPDGGSTWVLQG